MKKIILFIVPVFFLTTCGNFDGTDYRLKIKNNTAKYLYYYDIFTYPDTSFGAVNIPEVKDNYQIKPNSERSIPTQVSWERIFEKELRSDTLSIFIFDEDVINNIPWDTIRKNYLILKRYDLSYEDIDKLDWTISFP
jgi:hypothetical protein